jgi:drug/metabolite transporter (DMT)-like permease
VIGLQFCWAFWVCLSLSVQVSALLTLAALLPLAAAVCNSLYQIITRKFRGTENPSPAVLGPFSYGQLLWAMLLGYVVFGSFPDAGSILGMGVIAASGLYITYRAAAQTPLIADQKELSPSDFMRDTGQPR